MNNLKTKVMVTALAATMLIGGTQVFAAENDTPEVVAGDEVYSEAILLPGSRAGHSATSRTLVDEFTAPVSGQYYFAVDGKKINATGSTGIRTSFSVGGYDSNDARGCSSLVVTLEAGQVYSIEWEATSRSGNIIGLHGSVLAVDGYYQEIVPVPDSAPCAETTSATSSAATTAITYNNADPRYLSARNFVEGLYTNVLGREFDAQGSNEWIDMIMSGSATGTEVVEQMFASSEFEARNLSDEEFVETLFAVFGTDVSDEEEIMGDIAYGKTRSEIVSEFTASEQWASNCAYYGVNV